jgi:two-component system, OmpR family, heavy metal sensor histidine kinase CusS
LRSIQRHLTLSLILGFALLLGAGSTAIYVLTRAALVHEFDAGLRARALALVMLTELDQDKLKLEFLDKSRAGFNQASTADFYQLWRVGGPMAYRSESLGGADLPQRAGTLSKPLYWDLTLPSAASARAIGLKFSPRMEDKDLQHGRPPEVVLVLAADRRPLDRTLATLTSVLLAIGLLTLLATIPVVSLSLRRGHAPLEKLAQQATRITAHSLGARFPVETMPQELRPIATRLNDLLSRLEASFDRERRFSADLAHELRTPVAELRTHAEVEIAGAEGETAQSYREILDIALQMETILTRLLELARSEQGQVPLQLGPVPLAALVEEVWRPLARQATGKKLTVTFNLPPDAVIESDRALLASILSNLLSNATEYCPEGGRVQLAWRPDSQELVISNTVSDLSPNDLPHLFQRLWRKDESRTGSRHFGLGLSLSRSFAEAQGLSLTAHFNERTTLVLGLRKRAPAWGTPSTVPGAP